MKYGTSPVDTIGIMRRTVLVAVLVLAVGGATWALWPATRWPRAFYAPISRVVGADATAIVVEVEHNGWQRPVAAVPGAQAKVNRLRGDIIGAEASAPTSPLRGELVTYLSQLRRGSSMLSVTDGMDQFDVQARRQLEACGITPAGH